MIQIIGLILDIIGAVFLFFGTEILNNTLIEVLTSINSKQSNTAGTALQYMISTQNLEAILKSKKRARVFTTIGIVLLIVGFTGQVIACF